MKINGQYVIGEDSGKRYLLRKTHQYQKFDSLEGKRNVKFGGTVSEATGSDTSVLKVKRHKWVNPASR